MAYTLDNAVDLVPKNLAEAILAISAEREHREHPQEDTVVPEIPEEELEKLARDSPVQGDLFRALSGMPIPAATKAEMIEVALKKVDYLLRRVYQVWMHLIDFTEREAYRSGESTLRLAEDLLPTAVPEVRVHVDGEHRLPKDAREALTHYMAYERLSPTESLALHFAFVANLRTLVAKHGEVEVRPGLTLGQDQEGFYVRRAKR